MNRPPSDHIRRPTSCPYCSDRPMIALPDVYLDLMFGEPRDDGRVERDDRPAPRYSAQAS